MNIFLSGSSIRLFAVPIFQSCNKKQTAQGFSHAVSYSFSIHDLVSEIILMTLTVWVILFQSTLGVTTVVSIHASTWDATAWSTDQVITDLFQSTHPHGMRPLRVRIYVIADMVSIHASTWDATSNTCCIGLYQSVSIHASTWDATARTFRPYVARFCRRFSADRFKLTIF
jgi:hypothetical protein